MNRQPLSQHETRIELAENLELAVVVDDQRLCARISPTTARLLAGALLSLARVNQPTARSARASEFVW